MSEIRSQATPARDELAGTIHAEICEESLEDCLDSDWRGKCARAADRILAAGWSKLRTVNAPSELHALPVESVVRNRDGWIGEISIVSGKPVIFWIGNECEDELKDIALPATVLFTPGDAG